MNHYTLFPLHPPLQNVDAHSGVHKGGVRKGVFSN